jgi:hypothetical protein
LPTNQQQPGAMRGLNNFDQRNKMANTTDRIPRDPQERGESQRGNRFSQDQDSIPSDPWAIVSQSDKNPFEVAQQRQQNPFNQKQAAFGGWGKTSEDNLPKLSDFLQRDPEPMGIPRMGMMQNQQQNRGSQGFMDNQAAGPSQNQFSNASMLGMRRQPDMGSSGPLMGPKGVAFEPNPRGMPLLTAAKPFHTFQQREQPEEEPASGAEQWFTRDRSRAFEEEEEPSFQEEEPVADISNDYEWEPDAPAVIDYGHGSKGAGEDDEYDLPRGERLEDDDETDEERDRDVVTIDYGHGSGSGQTDYVTSNTFDGRGGREHDYLRDRYREEGN